MIFIANNPITAKEMTDTPDTPLPSTRGLFPKEDGWYDIDSDGNVKKIAEPFIITATVDANTFSILEQPDKTYAEVLEAYNKGCEIILRINMVGDDGETGATSHINLTAYSCNDNVFVFTVLFQGSVCDIYYDSENNLTIAYDKVLTFNNNVATKLYDDSDMDTNVPNEKAVVDYVKEKVEDEKIRAEKLYHYGDTDIEPLSSEYYTVSDNGDGTYSISWAENISEVTEIVVPYEVDGKTVTAVYTNISALLLNVEKVFLPKTILQLGDGVFDSFHLTEIDLKNIEIVGHHALLFNDFSKITLGKNIKEIKSNAFGHNTELTDVYVYSNDVIFGENCFSDCHEDLTIYCYSGSTAEAYAINNNLKYKLLDSAPVDDTPTEGSNNLITSGGVYEFGKNIENIRVIFENEIDDITESGLYIVKNEPKTGVSATLSGRQDYQYYLFHSTENYTPNLAETSFIPIEAFQVRMKINNTPKTEGAMLTIVNDGDGVLDSRIKTNGEWGEWRKYLTNEDVEPFYVTFTSKDGKTVDSVDKTFDEVVTAIEKEIRVKAIYSDTGRVFDLSVKADDAIVFSNNTSTVHYTFIYTKTSASLSIGTSPTYSDIVKDNTPTKDSENLITSGGVYDELNYELIGETTVTEADITEAGEEGITRIVLGNESEHIFSKYKHLAIELYLPVSSSINSANSAIVINAWNSLDASQSAATSILWSNSTSLIALSYTSNYYYSFYYDDYGKFAVSKGYKSSGNNIKAYTSSAVGAPSNVGHTQKKYIIIRSYYDDFKFPSGTRVSVYGRR